MNHGGEIAAELLEEIWQLRVPGSDRFVRLDDNSSNFHNAIGSLERLAAEMQEIRINDWPEKEGMIASVKATAGMIRTKYVNKTAVLTAISSVVTFIMVKFAEAPISEIATAAWHAVKNLF